MSRSTQTALSIMPYIFGALFMMAIVRLDGWMFPVVKDFNVQVVRREPTRVVFSGTMNKTRACEFLGVTATSGKDFSLGVSFDDDITRKTSTRPTGVQEWGPWHIDIAPEDNVNYIELIAMHNCRPFGMVHTALATINLEPR